MPMQLRTGPQNAHDVHGRHPVVILTGQQVKNGEYG
jgi:hypothetical protein